MGGCDVPAGCQALISTGYSSFPSSLLSVSDDGTDALFFTREVLVPDDHNGQTMKIYDARVGGGFFKLPASPPCAASDECHGPSSQAAPPLAVSGSNEHAGGNYRKPCGKRFVLKGGKCVKKPKRRHRKNKRNKKQQPSSRPGQGGPAMTGKRLVAFLVAALAAAAFAAPAQASIGIESFETTTSGDPEIQAGSHPDLTTIFSLEDPGEPEAAKNIEFNAPEGVFGNPNALTRCTAADYALMECPVNSQAGVITLKANYKGDEKFVLGTAPIYNMAPQSIETARLAFYAPTVNIPIAIPVAVRTADDYGLRFTVAEITQQIPLQYAKFTVWGMPGLSSHDSQRFAKGSPGDPAGCPGIEETNCGTTGKAVTLTVRPLLNMPTTCSGEELVTELDVQSYQDLDQPSHAESSYQPMTGCEHETFDPYLDASLTTTQTDSASGLNLRFHVPQTLGFTPSPSEARAVIVTLPEGLTINPDSADGQTMCTDAQANFDSEGPGGCPDQAKIGTIALGTPALDGPLIGSIYIGEPQPGNQYRLFMVLGGFGVNAKLIGTFHPDPATGRLTARFDGLPQVPFDDFDIHLFASDRGLLATPTRCTLYSVRAQFIPWNGRLANQTSEQFFSLDSGPGGSRLPRKNPAVQPAPGGGLDSSDGRRVLGLQPQARPRRWRPVPR